MDHGTAVAVKRASRAVQHKTKTDILRFAEYDTDGNQKLDFEEFHAFQPRCILEKFSRDQLRVWFDSADKDGNGTLCLNEFFMWTLESASTAFGERALEMAFSKYDGDKSGYLNPLEFKGVCTTLGFGGQSNELFHALDTDGTGLLSYKELCGAFRSAVPSSSATKQMLSAMVLEAMAEDDKQDGGAKKLIDTSGWIIRSHTTAGVSMELRRLLQQSGALVGDLMPLFDTDANPLDISIDDMEFTRAMRNHFGYRGPQHVLTDVFRSMDTDDSGVIGFDELYEFIQGHRHSLDARDRRALELRLPLPAGLTLDELRWDAKEGVWTLRVLLMEMLAKCNCGPMDLLCKWVKMYATDDAPQGVASTRRHRVGVQRERLLTRKQFLEAVRNLFVEEQSDLWEAEVMVAADHAFDAILKMVPGENFLMAVGILHLERWLMIPATEITHRMTGVTTNGQPRATSRAELARRLVHEKWNQLTPKSEVQRKDQRRRRAKRAAEEARRAAGPRKVDWVEKARQDIATFASLPAERAIAASTRRVLLSTVLHDDHFRRWDPIISPRNSLNRPRTAVEPSTRTRFYTPAAMPPLTPSSRTFRNDTTPIMPRRPSLQATQAIATQLCTEPLSEKEQQRKFSPRRRRHRKASAGPQYYAWDRRVEKAYWDPQPILQRRAQTPRK